MLPVVVKWLSEKTESQSSSVFDSSDGSPIGMSEYISFLLAEYRERVSKYDITRLRGSKHWLGSTKCLKE